MAQSSSGPSKRLSVKMVALIVILVLAGVVTVAVLTTQTSCLYYAFPGQRFPVSGYQTYWEKLVGGLCHPIS